MCFGGLSQSFLRVTATEVEFTSSASPETKPDFMGFCSALQYFLNQFVTLRCDLCYSAELLPLHNCPNQYALIYRCNIVFIETEYSS